MENYTPEDQTYNKLKNDRLNQGHREGYEGGMQTAAQRGFEGAFYHSLPILFKLNQLEGMIRAMLEGADELMLGEFKVQQLQELVSETSVLRDKVAFRLSNDPQQQQQQLLGSNDNPVPEDDLCDLFQQQNLNKDNNCNNGNNNNNNNTSFWSNSISDIIFLYRDLQFLKHTHNLQQDGDFLHLMTQLKSLILS